MNISSRQQVVPLETRSSEIRDSAFLDSLPTCPKRTVYIVLCITQTLVVGNVSGYGLHITRSMDHILYYFFQQIKSWKL